MPRDNYINKKHAECYNYSCCENIDNLIPKDFDELPLTLDANDIAKVLGISKQNAYILLHRKDFPSVQIGKRLVIPKPAFIRWMENPLVFINERI